jgi:hypothetical protein
VYLSTFTTRFQLTSDLLLFHTRSQVTRAMGVKLSKLSPTRGFCAELATALVIMIASQYGLPTSSSQCITGGIIGVGMMEGIMVGQEWNLRSLPTACHGGSCVCTACSKSGCHDQLRPRLCSCPTVLTIGCFLTLHAPCRASTGSSWASR